MPALIDRQRTLAPSHPRTGLASLCLFAFLLFPALAIAQDQRAVLELIVNQVPSGESLVVLRGNDALVPVSTLQKAGLRGFTGRRDTVGGEEFVSLTSLAPGITFPSTKSSFA